MEERVPLDRAMAIIDEAVLPLPAENVEVMMAAGRVLAERVHAWLDLPGQNVAGLDGFAVKAADLASAAPHHRIRLKIAGASTFSAPYEESLTPGTTVRVNTGTIIPPGTEAVVPAEEVSLFGEEAEFSRPVAGGRGIRPRAEEFRVGELILDKGSVLTPGRISLLIAAGWAEVKTVRPPRVRVIAAGDELKYPGQMLSLGQVYPSAAAGIVAWLKQAGISDLRLTLTADDALDILEALPEPGVADLIITLGGTGPGEHDVMFDALSRAGMEFLFLGAAVSPGHSTSFGLLEQTPVLCLPGGPSATTLMFHLLGRRALAALSALSSRDLPSHSALLSQPLQGKDDFERLLRVRLEDTPEGWKAHPFFATGLHREIAETDGVLRLPAGASLRAGEKINVWLTR